MPLIGLKYPPPGVQDPPLNLDYHADKNPQIRPVAFVEQVGIEDLHLRRLDSGSSGGNNINMRRAADCLVLATVQKRGAGSGTIMTATQVCGPECLALHLPYVDQATITLEVVPDAESVFTGWETADGTSIADIHYAQPGRDGVCGI